MKIDALRRRFARAPDLALVDKLARTAARNALDCVSIDPFPSAWAISRAEMKEICAFYAVPEPLTLFVPTGSAVGGRDHWAIGTKDRHVLIPGTQYMHRLAEPNREFLPDASERNYIDRAELRDRHEPGTIGASDRRDFLDYYTARKMAQRWMECSELSRIGREWDLVRLAFAHGLVYELNEPVDRLLGEVEFKLHPHGNGSAWKVSVPHPEHGNWSGDTIVDTATRVYGAASVAAYKERWPTWCHAYA